MLGWNKNEITVAPLNEGITKRNQLDLSLLSLANILAVT
jgi:hypothetical protein